MTTDSDTTFVSEKDAQNLINFKINRSVFYIETSLNYLLETDPTTFDAQIVAKLVKCYGDLYKVIANLPTQNYKETTSSEI